MVKPASLDSDSGPARVLTLHLAIAGVKPSTDYQCMRNIYSLHIEQLSGTTQDDEEPQETTVSTPADPSGAQDDSNEALTSLLGLASGSPAGS